MKEPKNLREGLELHLQRSLPVMSYDNGYRTEALSKAGILDLLAAYPAEPVPAESADEWARLDAANADTDAMADYVPKEKLRALRDRFDQSAKQMIPDASINYSLGARDAYAQAVRALSALLPEKAGEPS